jgi:hypothetical protein
MSAHIESENPLAMVWVVSIVVAFCFAYFFGKFTFWQSLFLGVFWPVYALQTYLFPLRLAC